jgi:hypothetical protein
MLRDRAVVGGLVLGLLAGGAAGLTGCGKSGYQFVENEDLGVFARLPDDWEVYDEEDLVTSTLDDGERLDADELERRTAGMWFRGFDSSDDPSITGAFELTAGEPRGFVRVRQLTADQREQVSLSVLRMLPTNGLYTISLTEASPDAQVVQDEPVEFDGGYNGVHTVVALDQGSEVAMLDQTVVLDPTSSTVYMFVVACDRTCYLDTHADEIKDLVDSWTIQEDGR